MKDCCNSESDKNKINAKTWITRTLYLVAIILYAVIVIKQIIE